MVKTPIRKAHALALLSLFSAAAVAQSPTDAISREFTIENRVAAAADAVAREFSISLEAQQFLEASDATTREFSVSISEAITVVDAVSREFSAENDDYLTFGSLDASSREFTIFDDRSATLFDSSAASIRAKPVAGTVTQQLAAANAAPPAFDGSWVDVARVDDNTRAAFLCGGVPDPLELPFVDAESYLVGVDEVTLDNCGSAFYRIAFVLPTLFDEAEITAMVNADDIAVAWLNGQRISAAALATDLQLDRSDADGKRVLTWPSIDPLDSSVQTYFRPGLNELVVAIVGDLGPTEPTGLELAAAVTFYLTGDVDINCTVDLVDLAYLLTNYGTTQGAVRGQGDLDHNGAVNLTDLAMLLQNFGTVCP